MEKKSRISAQLIGANIRRIRLEHGETQQYLGTLLGYGATTIANYESGYRMPDLESFFRIALHYGASLEDFIQDIDSTVPIDVMEPLGSLDSIDSTDSANLVDTIDSTDSKDPDEVHES